MNESQARAREIEDEVEEESRDEDQSRLASEHPQAGTNGTSSSTVLPVILAGLPIWRFAGGARLSSPEVPCQMERLARVCAHQYSSYPNSMYTERTVAANDACSGSAKVELAIGRSDRVLGSRPIPAALLSSDAMAPLPPLSSLDSRRRWCPTLLNLSVMPLVDDACDFRLDVEIAALCAVG